ncbi:Intradiol ring-cleavage dioxygenase [Macrophomina phaseolina MS6]|uniref:Intradiol ring-cleavage dioxygenase n=2 Tax=Macrophomina phaseolina TaxID=35725 RepID=K2R8G4_MACPH|nr:Intradiol ring-cleavage dioxygenase [Macrophomina phaseolina MS6]KAH7039109.1 Intradiol ring-cleavage dioxygenase [Macrophomina phaseolina]
MVNVKSFGAIALSLFAATEVAAHPHHDHKAEALERRTNLAKMSKRSLAHCADKLEARGIEAKNVARRQAMHDQLSKRALMKRDLDTVLNTTHHSNLTGVTPNTDPSILFTGNNSCILAPETTQGPYYVVGELFRHDITEDQQGVPLYMDIQIIDTNTCEPLKDVALDFWHCNATGVYSGIAASGNGDSSDTSNLDKTFLRGIQATDEDGVLQFQSIVPGHYTSRANHIHVLAHISGSWSLLPNGTISGGGNTAHVGQVFFDQDLLTEVETFEPYSTNTQEWTMNSEDSILSGEAGDIDPVVEYVLLGDSVADGIFSWISFGVDSTANYTVTPAAYYSANGGYENADSGSGMGGGSAPSGNPPSS